MRVLHRLRPSPAMVVACIALAVSLGGVGWAATTLPRNSVGAPQLTRNAVTSAKVKNRSLLAVDFRRGQLPNGAPGAMGPAGATGPAGPAGAKGDPGVSGYEVVAGTAHTATGIAHSSIAVCPGTKKAIGGGWTTGGTVKHPLSVTTATVQPDGRTFRTDAINSSEAAWTLRSHVVCVSAA